METQTIAIVNFKIRDNSRNQKKWRTTAATSAEITTLNLAAATLTTKARTAKQQQQKAHIVNNQKQSSYKSL